MITTDRSVRDRLLKSLVGDKSGQDLIEYALVGALIAFALVGCLGPLATSINSVFSSIESKRSNKPPSHHISLPSKIPGINQNVDMSQEKAWQNAVAALHEGAMLFQHSSTMYLRKTETVRVRISQNVNEDLRAGLVAEGIGAPEKVQVNTWMKVHLTGDSKFDVIPTSDEEQVLGTTGFNEWAFSVTPKQEGQWPLHLVVAAVIMTPWGQEKTKDFPVKEEYVNVVVTTPERIEYFLQDYWQWIAGSVAIPLIGWFWSLYSKRKKPKVYEQRKTKNQERTGK